MSAGTSELRYLLYIILQHQHHIFDTLSPAGTLYGFYGLIFMVLMDDSLWCFDV